MTLLFRSRFRRRATRWVGAGVAAICLAVALPPVAPRADMTIIMKDGRVLNLPLERGEVGAIGFDGQKVPVAPVGEPQPAGDDSATSSQARRAAAQERKEPATSPVLDQAIARALDAAERAERAAAAALSAAERSEKAGAEAAAIRSAASREPTRPAQNSAPAPQAKAPAAAEPAPPPSATAQPATDQAPSGRVFQVGPMHAHKTPSAVAELVRDGDVVEIEAATYSGDVAIWTRNNLVLKGVGGRPHIAAGGRSAEDKAIWVIKGNNVTVDAVELSGAKVSDHNGAGIRLEGAGFTLRNSYIHHNQLGIVTGSHPESDVVIENSEFAWNALEPGLRQAIGHNIYIGRARSFTLRQSYVHHAMVGHNVKSAAAANQILYNRLADERDGASSFIIDLPNGGKSVVMGNLIHQGVQAENWAVINYGGGADHPDQSLFVVNNTLVNDLSSGVFIQRRSKGKSLVVNNIFAGNGQILDGEGGDIRANLIAGRRGLDGALDKLLSKDSVREATGELSGNLIAADAVFVDSGNFDYRLRAGSPAIDSGIRLDDKDGAALAARFQYVHPRAGKPRGIIGRVDIGAYEFAP